MSATHTWVCFFLWISVTMQAKAPDVIVTCLVSETCILPCNFQPDKQVTVEWFRQDVLIYKYQQMNTDNTSKEHFKHEQLSGRASISPNQVSNGNATMILKTSGLKDRGTFKCRVLTSEGAHIAKVILKVEAPIRGLFLELSRLSGFEEIKCTTQGVFPAPRVTWATEPPTFEVLRPITRKMGDERGLYKVDSRIRQLEGQPDIIYICKMATSDTGPTWTASLRERAIRGIPGRDLTIPCKVPTYLNSPSLQWTFSNEEHFSRILTYDNNLRQSVIVPPWDTHVALDVFRVPFGDGSLRLMDPKSSAHTGSYVCEFFLKYSTHTERNKVAIVELDERSSALKESNSSYWWIIVLVVAAVALAVIGGLVYLKRKGKNSKLGNNNEESRELNSVKDVAEAAAP